MNQAAVADESENTVQFFHKMHGSSRHGTEWGSIYGKCKNKKKVCTFGTLYNWIRPDCYLNWFLTVAGSQWSFCLAVINAISAPNLCRFSRLRPLMAFPPGDHQEVPDPVPSARWHPRSERQLDQAAEHHPVPAEHHRRGLQRGQLHAQILCLQLTGEDLGHVNIWRVWI